LKDSKNLKEAREKDLFLEFADDNTTSLLMMYFKELGNKKGSDIERPLTGDVLPVTD
jgi:hypothetical protein